ncbi:uncharacterized protein I303_102953 [Kwoniella dejecticola CBS 10117]|uniref:Uncharacterized protein n=1 Tax=Kwoniella dejecticola CBS 10117 TaxID=1296121 RepID=A0A1A6AA69_9TREE|nr:uncharacterized protein I303_02972 [Kwoniella dejecticola CBS 10117]OBR86950.1 hypothetical protein I303_02972 [Kwoniella dejecticola CBS 10117]
MVFQSHVLSAKVQVDFENDGVIDMLGGPNTGTSYSLPGHIIISLPALPAPLEGRLREVKDLKLVMEGKSEFWDDHGRYTPMRLHTTTLTLATPSNPLLLPSHDPARPGAQRIKLAVAFDLRLPGWLPPSHDSEMTTISYGAIAHCTIGWTEPASTTYAAPSMASSSSSSPSMHSEISMESILPMRSTIMKTKSAKPFDSIFGNHSLLAKSTEKTCSVWSPFSLQRHRLPSAIGTTAQDRTERHFTLRPEADSTSPVECVVTVPDWVDVNGEEKSLKVSLRVRARRNAIEPQSMLVDSTNQSTVSSDLSASTATSSSASGSGSPLTEGGSRELESVPMERQGAGSLGKKAEDEMLTHILELGMEVEETERYSSTPSQSFTSSFPLPAEQPTRNSSQHQLISPRCNYADGGFLGYDDRPFKGMRTRQCLLTDDGNQRNFFFADKGLGLGEKWRKVNIVLPMPSLDSGKGLNTRPQPEMDGPFLRVRHDLKIRVVCKNGNSDDTQVVILSTPIKFGTRPSTMPSNKEKPAPLPAYIQLFHENGEQREGDPLPLYSKSDAISPTASSRAVPESPTPSYASLYPLTARPCSSRSPSPSSYSESSSSSSLGRRDRSSSPSPSSEDEPMDIDDQVISSDDDSVRNAQLTPNTNMNANSRKAARTLPRAVRAMA